MPTLNELFNLEHTVHKELFSGCTYPWEVVKKLESYIESKVIHRNTGKAFPMSFIGENVEIGEGTIIQSGAVILGPAIIGKHCLIQSGAYIRANVILEDNTIVGHATEVKNSILLNYATAAHFNYVGDSILGNRAHMAAGSIIANVKMPMKEIVVKAGTEVFKTGLQKFGAAIGDDSEIGCNAVLNPGSTIGKKSTVYPLVPWRGLLPEAHIAKGKDEVVPKS